MHGTNVTNGEALSSSFMSDSGPVRAACPEDDFMDLTYHPDLERLCFDADGRFTPYFIQRLRSKRIDLGVPYRFLGYFFRLNWGTIRKWETGATRRCSGGMRKYLMAFLAGDFDDRIKKCKWRGDKLSGLRDLPPDMRNALCRASNAYIICGNFPVLRRNMLASIMNCKGVSDEIREYR